MIDNYIEPAVGSMPLRSLHTEHLDRFYAELLDTGGTRRAGLAPKTVYDVARRHPLRAQPCGPPAPGTNECGSRSAAAAAPSAAAIGAGVLD
jgi:hypothetical protein